MSVIKNLTRNYGDFEVHIPHWEIADEGITALKGASGSGKSSVIRLLIGLDACPKLEWHFRTPDIGSNENAIRSEDIAQLPIEEKRLGVVFQNYELFPHMTARENIHFAAKARKIPHENLIENINHMSQQLRMERILDKRVYVLSGGERQRVALARALIGQPRFLFLDEPFSALDTELRDEARKLVADTILSFKIPTLLVSHDQADIDRLAQKCFFIKSGRLV